MSAGIRSGVNWMRLNDRSRMRAQQAVAAAAQADEELLDDAVLADDDLAELARQCAHGAVQFGNHRFFRGWHRSPLAKMARR
jgi:hypothetical protein